MGIYPDWHTPLHNPTVGDDVFIVDDDVITLEANAPRDWNWPVSVQPRSATGELSPHAKAIAALLKVTHRQTEDFLNKYLRSGVHLENLDDLRVDLKNLLENNRSVLEYTAHHIAARCTPPPSRSRVQFPIAQAGDTMAKFANDLDRWFPGLAINAHAVRHHLLQIQRFNGELWLQQLSSLTNFSKHHSLADQEVGDYDSVVLQYDGAGVRVGELGLKSLTISPGAVLRFQGASGQAVDLNGLCVLNSNTTSVPSADPRIIITIEKRKLYRIPGQTQSLATIVWIISKNVLRTVDALCSLLS
jgi:hypothetical protein